MDRRDSILKYIAKEQRGIEIGPWFGPLAPKRDGYQCLALDIADTDTLKRRASEDVRRPPEDIDRIEEVDLLGSSTDISELVKRRHQLGTFDYVVSSHNVEHMPNPIRFFQGCGRVLKQGGIISMAVPDRRACFDYFRPLTKLAEWIEASLEERNRPTFAQRFEFDTTFAQYDDGKQSVSSFHCKVQPSMVSAIFNLDTAFQQWLDRRQQKDPPYLDTHCWVFTPASFELLIRDSAYLGLIPFELVEISETAGNEFYVHLRATTSTHTLRPANYEAIRNSILRRVLDEAAVTSALRYDAELESKRAAEPDAQSVDAKHPHDGVEAEPAPVDTRLNVANLRIRQLEEAMAELHASSSWRLTEPLRRIVTHLRRLRASN
ncbi:methyltransferase domain-containing protein [Dyella kyungheensis]|uniref:Methyltransferase domain-containing protein n=1 Tax=Dyella kyungheensis TaxID=1242174 RepID=A0ABS2JRK5_9GAMM|nr:methyltransferase domain-containing protein [Dyella kyungheensis]MBM7121649.1 methyltransferase domain-containing protein [Dyella kyungheensis]